MRSPFILRSHRLVTGLALLAFMLGAMACADVPTDLGPTESAGTISLPTHRVSMILEFQPAGAIDSILVGPPGAYFRSFVLNDRVFVYSPSELTPTLRFRAFVKSSLSPRPKLTARVLSTATAQGVTDDGHGASISFDP